MELEKLASGTIAFVNKSKLVKVKGRSNILILLKNVENQFISNLCYVPSIKSNNSFQNILKRD